MVTSYWEMAASFVNHGAIDWQMFMDACGEEPLNVFVKLYPYQEELHAMFSPNEDRMPSHLERVVMRLPKAQEQLVERIEQFKEARTRWQAESQKRTA